MTAPYIGRPGMALWAYTPPSNQWPLIVSDWGRDVRALEFSTVAPGGFGDLACIVRTPEPRIPRPELAPFGKIALMDGPFACFLGEWSDPVQVMDGPHGEYLHLSALGGGVALRDDPDDSAYTNQTAQAIIAAEFSKRTAFLALDGDQGLILPAAPATTFSPVYDGYDLEQILHDLAFDLGDYAWTVYDHPRNRDAAGFPTCQVAVHPRDAQTISYTALGEDIVSWRVTPSTQRAYNVVQVAYVDPAAGPGVVTVSDSRLNGDGSQGYAPFRRRKLRRSLGRVPLTSAQATTIANAWLGAYKNLTNKVEVTLRSIRDANGLPLPLSHVRADGNLFIPELAVRGQNLTAGGFGPVVGANQFYIVETVYREDLDGAVSLKLVLDNYADQAGATLAQLKLSYEAALRARGVSSLVRSLGANISGPCGATIGNQSAGGAVAISIPFPYPLSRTPSSITLTPTTTAHVTGSATATNITATGFTLNWTETAAGATTWLGSYLTVGA
ncbi:MAG TPA: hypothetical protein VF808_08240 [Ktedonobacterales bacterium]